MPATPAATTNPIAGDVVFYRNPTVGARGALLRGVVGDVYVFRSSIQWLVQDDISDCPDFAHLIMRHALLNAAGEPWTFADRKG